MIIITLSGISPWLILIKNKVTKLWQKLKSKILEEYFKDVSESQKETKVIDKEPELKKNAHIKMINNKETEFKDNKQNLFTLRRALFMEEQRLQFLKNGF